MPIRSAAIAFPVALGAALAAHLPASEMTPAAPPAGATAVSAPAGSAFTFQGYLVDGVSATGPYDLEFALYDSAVAGAQIGSSIYLGNHLVTNGVFTVVLDFGAGAFGGGARWLAIRSRPGGSTDPLAQLGQRRELRPVPMALSLPNVFVDEPNRFVGVGRDFRVSLSERFGIRAITAANTYGGMYVETAHAEGTPFYGYATAGTSRVIAYYDSTACLPPACTIPDYGGWTLQQEGVTRLQVPLAGGLRVGPSADYSVVITNTTGSDGVRILDTADDAIQIGSDPDYPNYGVYVPSPGVSSYGLWPNTAQAAGEWALYTVDKVESANVFTAGVTQIARVAAGSDLAPGDVVGAIGSAPGVLGSNTQVPVVRRAAESNGEAVIGVVASRMALLAAPGKEGEDAFVLHSVTGVARAGDFVAVVVQGVARVRVASTARVTKGERLTAGSEAGSARPLASRMVDGMSIAESAFAFAVALDGSEADGLALAYIRSR